MFDIWSFLLQTLNVSGVAALLLTAKALFKDKLPPKWQFAIWGILGVMILIPAGVFGTYTLIRWQTLIEILKSFFGDYGFTKVYFPFPAVRSVPTTVADWLFLLYAVGVLVCACQYTVAYFGLKRALRFGNPPREETLRRIQEIASAQGIALCKVVEVSELPSAFVCGIFRPMLVIPAEGDLDDKVILHELFHLKNKDTLWSAVICALKTLHWCNPLIAYCANRALGDMESRCDQSVLEHLENEERREYGRILLSMANERFSKIPGSTSIHNGGKNIRLRIENIARFKKYPKGMKLVSVCVLLLLAFPLFTGVQAASIHEFQNSVSLTLASARSIPCTTYAGAFDAYGKAVLYRNGYYRAMCAPEALQKELETEMLENGLSGQYPDWDSGLEEWANAQKGYHIYNLTEVEKNTYEGLLVVELNYPPDGKTAELYVHYLAVRNLRVQKENGRWVALPLEDFRYTESRFAADIAWGCYDLPGIVYAGEVDDFHIEMKLQTVHTLYGSDTNTSDLSFLDEVRYDTAPNPNGKFNFATRDQSAYCIYLGDESKKDTITHVGFAYSSVYEGKKRPVNPTIPVDWYGTSSSNQGSGYASILLKPEWDSLIDLNGGGSGVDPYQKTEFPQCYAVDFYINGEKTATVDLYPKEGGTVLE